MASMTWIKIVTSIFDDEKIKLIDSLPDRDAILVIWFKILCQAGKSGCGGALVVANRIPLTDEMLSTVFNRPLNTIRLALKTFQEFGMIEITEERIISIPKWEKYQQVDYLETKREQDRNRQRRHRDQVKLIGKGELSRDSHVMVTGDMSHSGHVTVTSCHAVDIEEEKEKEKNEQTYPHPPKTENSQDSQSVVFLKDEKEPSEEILTRLLNAGFSPKDANMIIGKYPFDRISMVLEYAKNKKPTSLRGYVFKALSEDWSLSEDTPTQVGMDQYRTDLNTWKSFPYGLRRKYINQGGYGPNTDYPEPGWLRKTLEEIDSEKKLSAMKGG
ncbi:MAG: putative phage replisome organizer [Leptospirillum rubarum]|nr:MAG: putative phage replisome organizer [Leptospirillum rubarum]